LLETAKGRDVQEAAGELPVSRMLMRGDTGAQRGDELRFQEYHTFCALFLGGEKKE